MKKKFNLIIADDHVMFLDGLYSILIEMEEIASIQLATDGGQVLRLLERFEIDLVVTDINMPKVDGLELLSEVKQNHSKTKVFVLSMLDDHMTIDKVIRRKADGYLLKFADKMELQSAIRQVLDGESYFSSSVKAKYMDSVFERKKLPNVSLSKREFEILQLLTDELTSKEISEKLCISVNTVETHRKNILLKTGARTTTGAVKYGLKTGIIE